MYSNKTVLWKNAENNSLEYFTLCTNNQCVVMEGTIIMFLEQSPAKITYKLLCDSYWKTKHVHILQERDGKISQLTLSVDEAQLWHKNQTVLPFAAGLFDVDLEVSPATNILPIHRLSLDVGKSKELDTVWVRFPSLKLERLQQRYTRLSGRCYKYEAPKLGFEVQLEVDEAGLIHKYGELWRQIV